MGGHEVSRCASDADHERDDAGDDHRAKASRPIVSGGSQQTSNSGDECAAGRRESQRRVNDSAALELDERLGVADRVAADGKRDEVAAVLAFAPDARREPPDSGMVEEQRFRERLQQVDEEVVSPDVRELVSEDRFDLRRRQPGERRNGQQNHRPHPPDDRRRVHVRRVHDVHDGA